MRSLVADSVYFGFLDETRSHGDFDAMLAPMYLMREFPTLRNEEAKAILADWRESIRRRR